jgi:hypothetical protein
MYGTTHGASGNQCDSLTKDPAGGKVLARRRSCREADRSSVFTFCLRRDDDLDIGAQPIYHLISDLAAFEIFVLFRHGLHGRLGQEA